MTTTQVLLSRVDSVHAFWLEQEHKRRAAINAHALHRLAVVEARDVEGLRDALLYVLDKVKPG